MRLDHIAPVVPRVLFADLPAEGVARSAQAVGQTRRSTLLLKRKMGSGVAGTVEYLLVVGNRFKCLVRHTQDGSGLAFASWPERLSDVSKFLRERSAGDIVRPTGHAVRRASSP